MRQPVKAGVAALRAQRLNVTRSVRDLVPLRVVKITRASTRWMPGLFVRGLTGRTQRLPLLGFDSVRTTLPSIVNTTRAISLPLTDTRNGVP